MRIIIASLVPALWVVAAGQGLPQSLAAPALVRWSASISARQAGKGIPWDDSEKAAHALRHFNRRLSIQSGKGGFCAAAGALPVDFAPLSHPGSLAAGSLYASPLSRPWQFFWRTVAEPRAPSSVG